MQNILRWNIDFFKQRHNRVLFIILLLYVCFWFYGMYYGDFFKSWLRHGNSIEKFLKEYLAAATIFGGSLMISCIVRHDFELLGKKETYILLVFGAALSPFIFSNFFYQLISPITDSSSLGRSNTLKNVFRSLTAAGTITAIWFLFIREKEALFPIKRKGLLGYIVLLMCMVPLLWFASKQPGFIVTYPRVFRAGIPKTDYSLIAQFEIVYAGSFVIVEWLFRGLFILFFARVLKEHIILPAACLYFFIHINKPELEALSSFFGGTILGIVAYYSKSILGGIVIHIGIALLMEYFAILQILW